MPSKKNGQRGRELFCYARRRRRLPRARCAVHIADPFWAIRRIRAADSGKRETGRERGRKKTTEKNGRWREEGNSSLRAEMRSIDRPFHSMTIRCQLRISDYFCKKITSGRRGTIPRAVKNRCLQRRTENYPRAIICWTERLSRERKLSGLSSVAEVGRAGEEDARTLTLRRWSRERRGRREGWRGWPATATFRRASRCFRRETIVSCLRVRREDSEGESARRRKGEKGNGRSGEWMANSARRIIAALFLRLYIRWNERVERSRREWSRTIKDPRTKSTTLREDNVMNKIGVWRLLRSCSLKYVRHYCREEEKKRKRIKVIRA